MPANILIIDDEPSARQTLENQLFPEGYSLHFANNGAEGMAQACSLQPDVIICDVMMPGMDGFEFCRQIRADDELGQIPIILITALNDRQAKMNGLQAGADEFISKPIDTLELRARLRTLTRLDRFRKLNDERLKLVSMHSDLVQAHEALLTNETRFRNLIETSSDAIFVVDRETSKFVLTNPAASHIYGYSQAEFLQMQSADISAEPQKTREAIRDGIPYVPERLHRRKDGTTFPVEISGSYFTEQGREFHTAFIRDISERRQAEEAKRQAELRYRAIFNQAHDAIFILNFDGEHLDANRRAAEMLGYTVEEMRWLSVKDLSAELPQSLNILEKILNGERIPPYERRFCKKNGEILPVEINAELVRDTHGQPLHIQSVVRDISERKQAEKALRASEEQYRAMFDTNTAMKLLIDPATGAIIEANQASAAFYGWTIAQLKAMNINQINTLSDENIKAEMLLATRQNRSYFMFRHRLASGELRDVEVHSSPIEIGGRRLLFSVIHDISERKRAEERLSESENRLATIFRASPLPIIITRLKDRQYLAANIAFEKLTDYSIEEIVGRTAEDLNIWVDLRNRDQMVAELNAHGAVRNFEAQVQSRHGQCYDIIFSAELIELDHESCVITILQDITERRQAETRLRESEERFRSFIEQSTDGFLLADERGVIIEWNSALAKIIDLKRETALGAELWDIQFQMAAQETRARVNREQLKDFINGMLQSGQSPMFGRVLEVEIQTFAGKTKFIQQTSFPIRTAQGYRIGGVIRDVTELKVIQQRLQENEEKYHSIVSHAVEAVALIDELGVVIEWNKAAEDLTGILAGEVLGQQAWDIQGLLIPRHQRASNDVEGIVRKVKEVLLSGKGEILGTFASDFTRTDGNQLFINQKIFPIPTAHGFRICSITHDVTAAKEAEMALQAANDDLELKVRERTAELQESNFLLEKASRVKDEFMAAVSHELRTPLSGVLGITELLQMPHTGVLNEKQLKYIATIEKSGKRLLETINNVLSFTMLQSGKANVSLEKCSLNALCRTALQEIQPMAEKKRQRIQFSSNLEPVTVLTDEKYLRMTVMLLLDNARKFTPEAGEFGIEIVDSAESVQLVVWDKGIGIKDEDLSRLFKPFTQLDARLSRQYEGSGLGLALVKQIVNALDGSIEAASVDGEGSRFTVTLPRR